MAIFDYFLTHSRYLNVCGIGAILALAFLFSNNKSQINVRLILTALVMQFLSAFFVLKTTLGTTLVRWVANFVAKLYAVADEGIMFVFGSLGVNQEPWGFVFAFKVLPIIVFFGALMSLLQHFGIVQRIVALASMLVRPVLGTSGAETLCVIANSFLGQTEAPLLVKKYISTMTDSEMLLVMVSGMGTISGAILVVYAAIGIPITHLLAASVMAIPATIIIAKILYPETKMPATAQGIEVAEEEQTGNILDAVSQGTSDGLQLALNVGAMLISFIALIGLLNMILGFGAEVINSFLATVGLSMRLPALTLQSILGVVFAPIGYFFGLQGREIWLAGQLIGMKVAVNEMLAYTQLVSLNLSDRAVSLLTYALCGFSNFSCIGIQIGGIGALAPSKRATLSRLGFRAVLGGMLANLLSAMVAGILL